VRAREDLLLVTPVLKRPVDDSRAPPHPTVRVQAVTCVHSQHEFNEVVSSPPAVIAHKVVYMLRSSGAAGTSGNDEAQTTRVNHAVEMLLTCQALAERLPQPLVPFTVPDRAPFADRFFAAVVRRLVRLCLRLSRLLLHVRVVVPIPVIAADVIRRFARGAVICRVIAVRDCLSLVRRVSQT